jgi:hypothetical protein
VAPQTVVRDVIALAADSLCQALIVAEAVLEQTALDLLAKVRW